MPNYRDKEDVYEKGFAWGGPSKAASKQRLRHPPHLKGKAIGLFYKYRFKKRPKDVGKNGLLITLRIPPAVLTKVLNNIDSISKIAKVLNIPIQRTLITGLSKNTENRNLASSIKSAPKETKCSDDSNTNKKSDVNRSTNMEYGVNSESTMTIDLTEDSDDDIKPDLTLLKPKLEDKYCPNEGFKHESKLDMSFEDVATTENIQKTDHNFKKQNIIPKLEPDCGFYIDTEPSTSSDFHGAAYVHTNENIQRTDHNFKKPNIIPKLESDCGFYIDTEPSTSSDSHGPAYVHTIENIHRTDHNFKKPNIIPKLESDFGFYIDIEPSTTSDSHGSAPRLLSLRGGGDYKYGYEDIITGTFDEKLEECLSKGVSISALTEDVKQLNVKLYEEYAAMVTKNGFKKLLQFREKLPTYQKNQEVLDVINNNQVIVISGETGCGKSTQVPQIILDRAILNRRGANVKIIVTQPRRIAASSLAARVAAERAEKMGNSVGYAVRLDKIEARARGSVTFCTTGILLADLEMNQGLTNYSHVILDEVHERDCFIDLSMCMLKKVLKKRKDLKLILMSATLDAENLSSFFDRCPVMHIEGLAYPVEDIYLEDILKLTKFTLKEDQGTFKNKGPFNFSKGPFHRGKRRQRNADFSLMILKQTQHTADVGPWVESIKHTIDRDVYQTLLDPRIEDLNIHLMLDLLIYICKGAPGAILVFLPGIGPITKLISFMNKSDHFPTHSHEIYALHSRLPTLEQHKIFERPPEGVRKIIIATNIAETSITIDDIVYVVDCAKVRITGLSLDEQVSTLKTEWVAQANLHQRRGRAGRCQPGICYHLVTSYRAKKLPVRHLPELQRSDLLEPVLTIKRLRLGMAIDALKMVPSPPDVSTIQRAVKHLQQCGALNDKEKLTPLGWHLARLPVHPSAGKLLLLGSLFGCLDRAASIAAVWGFKDPFMLVIGKEKEVDAVKRQLAFGEPSDHIAISEAIIQWELCSRYQRRSFCDKHFLSHSNLELLSDMKNQLGDNLKQMGFLASGDVKSSWENRNKDNLSLFKALVAASLYPNIATVRWLQSKRGEPKFKVFTTEKRDISVHPSSVLATGSPGTPRPTGKNPGANWLVYWLKQRSETGLFLHEVTMVYTLPLLFFGEMQVTYDQMDKQDKEKIPEYTIQMDGEQFDPKDEVLMSISTIKIRCKKQTADVLFEMRSLLDQVLAGKVMATSDHSTRHNDFAECVLKTVIELITAEDERAEYLGGDDDHSESDSSESESKVQWHR